MESRTYPSAVDWWIGALLIGAPLLSVVLGVSMLFVNLGAGLACTLTGTAFGLTIYALCHPTHYTLTDKALLIRSGWIEESVDLRRILHAEKSSSPWGAPALSLRRIKLTLHGGSCVISPKDRDEFLADLHARLARLPIEDSPGRIPKS